MHQLPLSPASRGRGLKLGRHPAALGFVHVARFTRAWIETSVVVIRVGQTRSPASRGRGLKHKLANL